MLDKFRKYKSQESGQSMVMVAIILVVLLGFAALAVDVGAMAFQKSNLQNAADAAALAGAQDLPVASTAIGTAEYYAGLNGDESVTTTVTTPYNGDSNLIEVVCVETASRAFAGVLGVAKTEITARAVAQHFPAIPEVPAVPPTPGTPGTPGWDGGTVPFINYAHYTKGQEILIWDKKGAGNFNCLLHESHDPYYRFDLSQGAIHANGKINNIKSELVPILQENATVYLISLSNNTISGVTVPTTKGNGKPGSFQLPSGNAGQNETVATKYLVLFKCKVVYYDVGKTIKFKIQEIYDLGNTNTGDIGDIVGAPPTLEVPGIPGTPGTPGTPYVESSTKLVQ